MADIVEDLFSCDLKNLKIRFEKVDVNCEIPGTDGCTPLHVVAGIETENNKESILAFLLENGADPNARSFENLTPVHIAAMWNNCFELEKLLQNGGNPWLTDHENKNSFDMAADNHSYEAFQLLNRYLAEDKLNFNCIKTQQSPIKTVDFPKYVGNKNTEDTNFFSNTAFMTANENFPFFFSSNDEDDDSDDHILSLSKFLKRKSASKCSQNKQFQKCINLNFSDSSIIDESEKMVENQCTKPVDTRNKILELNNESSLNNGFIFSWNKNDASDVTAHNISQTNDRNERIIDTDDKNRIVLIESKSEDNNMYSSSTSIYSIGSNWKSFQNINTDCSTVSSCSTHSMSSVIIPHHIQEYSNSKIFQELVDLGDNPGPVLDHTRRVYLLRLARLKSGCKVSCELPKPKYCPEVYLLLENKLDMAQARNLEIVISEEFDADSGKKWREGNQRCCFNYFLLDPRVTQNLPSRASNLTPNQKFSTFLDSLFYVGKGTRGRPYSHLFEAAKSLESGDLKSDKVRHILDIWEAGFGVISLHCFQNSIPVEAYTREACIIEAVGLTNLTNIRKGDFYGSCTRFTTSRKRLIGVSLLHRALQIFLLEGERQIKPKDVQNKWDHLP